MEMRPLNEALAHACSSVDRCSKCSMRIGCPVRMTFYVGDFDFEIPLQQTELSLVAKRLCSQDDAFTETNKLRIKRKYEKAEHPYFSYI